MESENYNNKYQFILKSIIFLGTCIFLLVLRGHKRNPSIRYTNVYEYNEIERVGFYEENERKNKYIN